MSETIVRSSPYRRSDCITIVCLLELKSAAQRYLFVVCLLAAVRCSWRERSAWQLRLASTPGGWGEKILAAVARMGTPHILCRV